MDLKDVPCGACVENYNRPHRCDSVEYCPCDQIHPNDPFSVQRQKHLKTITEGIGMSTIPESDVNSNCTHYSSLKFINIQDDPDGNYWEYWDCSTCGILKSIPYDPGGLNALLT